MTLDIVIAFFVLGALAKLLNAELHFPKALYQSLTLFLLLAIGLKGGVALSEHANWSLLTQSAAVIGLGLVTPLIAFAVLYWIGQCRREDAASIAAHYGAVSVGTFAVAVAVLESRGIDYEPYFPLFVVLLEMPAIAVGLALAGGLGGKDREQRLALLREIFLNQGIVLLTGGLIIGAWAGDRVLSVAPFFFDLFQGALALFLLEMGIVAAAQLPALRRSAAFMTAYGVGMPLLGGVMGSLLGIALGLSVGGVALMAVIAASASYIAVPAVMRVALPSANHGLSIAASLAITFPFNIVVGIPIYLGIAQAWQH
jgi:uncharacterized protein